MTDIEIKTAGMFWINSRDWGGITVSEVIAMKAQALEAWIAACEWRGGK